MAGFFDKVIKRQERGTPRAALPRLSPTEMLILEYLITQGELYGMGLVGMSEGKLKRGTIYVTLARMEEKGFISSRLEEKQPEAIGLPRRMYQVTGEGVRIYNAYLGLLKALEPAWAT